MMRRNNSFYVKILISMVLLAIYILVTIVPSFAVSMSELQDVSRSDWAYNAIQEVISKGLMSGTSSKTFSPSGKVARAQVVQVLYNIGHDDISDYNCPFEDIQVSDWFYNSVVWCYNNNIVSGTSFNAFSPNIYITRQDLCVMFYNYFSKYLQLDTSKYFCNTSIYKYKDCFSISVYARDAMSWAVRTGFMSGNSSNTLNPKGLATRRELAQLLINFIKVVNRLNQVFDEPICYKELTIKSVPYKGSGTTEDPYVFLCQDGYVLTKEFLSSVLGFSNEATEGGETDLVSPSAIILEIRENDSVYGKLLVSTTLDGTRLQMSFGAGYLISNVLD